MQSNFPPALILHDFWSRMQGRPFLQSNFPHPPRLNLHDFFGVRMQVLPFLQPITYILRYLVIRIHLPRPRKRGASTPHKGPVVGKCQTLNRQREACSDIALVERFTKKMKRYGFSPSFIPGFLFKIGLQTCGRRFLRTAQR